MVNFQDDCLLSHLPQVSWALSSELYRKIKVRSRCVYRTVMSQSAILSFFKLTNPKSGRKTLQRLKSSQSSRRSWALASWVPSLLSEGFARYFGRVFLSVCLWHVCVSAPLVKTFLLLVLSSPACCVHSFARCYLLLSDSPCLLIL